MDALALVECQRITATLESAVEKLGILASLTTDFHNEELNSMLGEEISRIIQEQVQAVLRHIPFPICTPAALLLQCDTVFGPLLVRLLSILFPHPDPLPGCDVGREGKKGKRGWTNECSCVTKGVDLSTAGQGGWVVGAFLNAWVEMIPWCWEEWGGTQWRGASCLVDGLVALNR